MAIFDESIFLLVLDVFLIETFEIPIGYLWERNLEDRSTRRKFPPVLCGSISTSKCMTDRELHHEDYKQVYRFIGICVARKL